MLKVSDDMRRGGHMQSANGYTHTTGILCGLLIQPLASLKMFAKKLIFVVGLEWAMTCYGQGIVFNAYICFVEHGNVGTPMTEGPMQVQYAGRFKPLGSRSHVMLEYGKVADEFNAGDCWSQKQPSNSVTMSVVMRKLIFWPGIVLLLPAKTFRRDNLLE